MRETDKTIAQVFKSRVEENGDKTLFIYHKEGDFAPFHHKGKLRTMSWRKVGEMVKNVGMGLLALGAEKGDPISIMSMTRYEWVVADLALLSIGGETGSIYPSNLPEQAQYIINDLSSKFVFVEERWQRDGLLRLKDKSPQLKKIITIGCEAGDDPLCMTFEELMELGKSNVGKYEDVYEKNLAAGTLDDVASYIYTSGTTGVPKGAVHSHESLTFTLYTGTSWLPVEPGMVDLAFLPMAHIFEQFAGSLLDIYRGDVIVAFARSLDTVAKDFGLVKPHFCRAAPRLFEKIYSTVWTKSDVLLDMTPRMLSDALEISKRVKIKGELYGNDISDDDMRKYQHYDEHNYHEMRELVLGGNLTFFVAGGAPLSKDINEFFWCLGIPIYELYGMTETGGATTNKPGAVKIGTVGKAWPSGNWPGFKTETKLSPEGEILMKGPNVMLRYHNKPEETAEAIKQGWMHSGDIAELDEDGFFIITDRIKDIIITAGGKNVAPVRIEGLIKEDPLISQVVVFGDRKKYLTALISLDEEGLEERAKELKIYGSYEELTQHTQIRNEVERIVEEKNKELARFETIKKFTILKRDLTIEEGDLTPTMKVKRREVYKKYSNLVDSRYDE